MSYKLASPWAVFRIDGATNLLLTRFRKRSDADQYAKLLKTNTPYKFEVIFDI
ncbi:MULTISPECIES: hypothetical protein [unclassified Nodularia (in: cyanobacteria)]|uniref:hypothetical protein n=1 Tax=unclassified Nodularia (in: cyanobacteria) TaxID=2656917 RepID=UPI001880F44E|nr:MULTISPECIES: hypothetical protein [unclassified Nodularia (in: cyanobacteria)]MBE9199449.1 hypothetical protein [Nodularia sp. LEGE 06071]MCC2695175.1 hypothetical protein [Nodularia sp. LEGE 04288]